MAFLSARSVLFVPANRPDRYEKALASGADMVVADLEDAVPRALKADARKSVAAFFEGPSKPHVTRALRINGLATLDGARDMVWLADAGFQPDVILLPKTSGAHDVTNLLSQLREMEKDCGIIAIIESAEGMENAAAIAMAPKVAGICFGSADYAAETGGNMQWDALLYGRGRILQAAARAAVLAIDGAWLAISDPAGLAEETNRLPGLGFDGRVVIHPSQVAAVNAAFHPAPSDLARARKIIDATTEAGGAVLTVDGIMVDRPLLLWAERILARADPGSVV